jgi:acetoin utilization deacetylase AcuC-like enzyme
MQIFVSKSHRAHAAKVELVPGKLTAALDVARRVDVVTEALVARRLGTLVDAPPATWQELCTVHSANYLSFLEGAWDRWRASFGDSVDALPYVWSHRNRPPRCPQSIEGQLGYFMFDGVSPITPGMWPASIGAAGAALAAAASVKTTGATSVAVCRPPGHHAGVDLAGGSSYINHTALAAAYLASTGARVAVLDVDAHHGNGTQDIFWRRNDVLTVSLHCDPAFDYPYFSGYADEVGEGPGEGFNLNMPLAPGSDWRQYSPALRHALQRVREFGPDYVVIALGVDSSAEDPVGKLKLQRQDFSRLGELLRELPGRRMFVFEGGYNLDEMGVYTANVLEHHA